MPARTASAWDSRRCSSASRARTGRLVRKQASPNATRRLARTRGLDGWGRWPRWASHGIIPTRIQGGCSGSQKEKVVYLPHHHHHGHPKRFPQFGKPSDPGIGLGLRSSSSSRVQELKEVHGNPIFLFLPRKAKAYFERDGTSGGNLPRDKTPSPTDDFARMVEALDAKGHAGGEDA